MKTKSNNYELYPPITPFNYGFIEVDEHKLYFEECGNPNGIPIIFFHGGPGSGCYPEHRRLFNPKVFHVVFLDQRGSGRSKPCRMVSLMSLLRLSLIQRVCYRRG